MISVDDAPQRGRLSLTAERFYWGKLDTSQLGAGQRPNRRSLGYLFERTLPVPIEEIHAVYERVSTHGFIACGMCCADLEGITKTNLVALSPAEIPPFLDCDIPAKKFNLLTGPFTPPHVRRIRRHVLTISVVLLVALTTLLVFGMERRIIRIHAQTTNHDQQARTVAQTVLEDSTYTSTLPISLQLTALVRELRSTRNVQIEPVSTPDATIALAELLQYWPTDVSMQTSSISVTPHTITIQSNLKDADSVQQLADALQSTPSWELQQPRISSAGNSVRSTIQFARRSDATLEVQP